MILGAALLSLNDAVSKFLTESYPVGQVIGLRQAASLLVILPRLSSKVLNVSCRPRSDW